jgi:hypothetical protein
MDGLKKFIEVGDLVKDGHDYGHASRPPVTRDGGAVARQCF